MKIQKIKIKGFRGIPWIEDYVNENDNITPKYGIEIDLKKRKNLVLFSENAKGKSSIAEAIEYLLFERLKKFNLRPQETSETDLIHVDSFEKGAKIEVIFKDNREESLFLLPDGKIDNSHRCSTDLRKIAEKETVFINEDILRDFLEATFHKRNEIFTSTVLNLDKIRNFREGLGTLNRNFSNDIGMEKLAIQLAEIKTQITHEENIIAENLERLDISMPEKSIVTLLKNILDTKEFHEHFDEKTPLLSQTVKWDDLIEKFVPSQEYYKKEEEEKEIKQKLSNAKSLIEFNSDLIADLDKMAILVKEFSEEREIISKLIFDELYEKGIKTLEKTEENLCPLCEQPLQRPEIDTREKFSQFLLKRREKFSQIREIENKIRSLKEKLNANLNSVMESWKTVIDVLETKKKWSQLYITDIFKLQVENITEYIKLLRETETAIMHKKVTLKEKAERLSKITDPNEEKRNKLTSIRNIIKARKEIQRIRGEQKKLEKKIRTIDKIKKGLNKVVEGFKKEELELNKAIISEISNIPTGEKLDIRSFGSVQKYFHHFYRELQSEVIPYIEMTPDSLMLKLKFYGRDKNVHAIMSEGMKKAFILSIWLANMKRANKNFKFVILDDVTDSLDNHYRCRFIDLLDKEFSDVQKIILTHDNFLFQYCKNYLTGSLYKFMNIKIFTKERIILEVSDYLQHAKKYLKEGDKNASALYLRLELERFLQKLRGKYLIPVSYKNTEQGPRIEDLLQSIEKYCNSEKTIVNWSDIEPQKVQRLSNIALHYLDPRFSELVVSNIADCIEAFESFQKLFCCQCGEEFKKIEKPYPCKCGKRYA